KRLRSVRCIRPKAHPKVTMPMAPKASKGVDINAATRLDISGASVRKKSTVHVLNVSRIRVKAKLSAQTSQNWRRGNKMISSLRENEALLAGRFDESVEHGVLGNRNQFNNTITSKTADGRLITNRQLSALENAICPARRVAHTPPKTNPS